MKKQYQFQLIPVNEMVSPISILAPGQDNDRKRIEEGLNWHGRSGWTLVAIIGPLLVMQREVTVTTKATDNEHDNEGTKLGSD